MRRPPSLSPSTVPPAPGRSSGRPPRVAAPGGRARAGCVRALRCVAALAGLLLLLPAVAPGSAGTGAGLNGGQREYQIKGAFLYKFIHYTTWPEEAFDSDEAPIVVALLGTGEPLEEVAAVLEGRELHGRSLEVRRVRTVASTAGAHVVFAVGADARTRERLLASFSRLPTLLVGDDDPFAELGGTVNFYLQDDKVRFAVNTAAMERSALKISSQLLKLARIVREEDR